MELKPLVLSDIFTLSDKISTLIKELRDVEVTESAAVTVLSNLEKFLPILPIFTNNQLSEEDIKGLTLKQITELVEKIIDINEVEEVVGLFKRIAKKIQPSEKK